MTFAFAVILAGLGLLGAFVAGLLGVGGAIVMVPLLLYAPAALGVGELDMKAITGITMVQVFVASVSGMIAHRGYRAVHPRLAWVGGLAKAAGALVGAVGSAYIDNRWLLIVFAVMATAAAILMFAPVETPEIPIFAETVTFPAVPVAIMCGIVGVAAGLVGAGGSFLLVPLLLVCFSIPIRVTIGSSLAITAVSAVTGFLGKLATGQIPWTPAILVAVGALPGARLGAAVSRRVPGTSLKIALGVTIVLSAMQVWWDLLFE
jgi:uncharacterized protein